MMRYWLAVLVMVVGCDARPCVDATKPNYRAEMLYPNDREYVRGKITVRDGYTCELLWGGDPLEFICSKRPDKSPKP